MRQDEQKAELIAQIREKLKTMSDQDVLRVLAAYEADEKGDNYYGNQKSEDRRRLYPGAAGKKAGGMSTNAGRRAFKP